MHNKNSYLRKQNSICQNLHSSELTAYTVKHVIDISLKYRQVIGSLRRHKLLKQNKNIIRTLLELLFISQVLRIKSFLELRISFQLFSEATLNQSAQLVLIARIVCSLSTMQIININIFLYFWFSNPLATFETK